MHWIMKTLHHWFGAIFAAFFFVISISGSWLVIDKYVFVPSVPVEQRQLAGSKTLEQDRAFVSKMMRIYPLEDISQVKFPIEEQPFYTVKLSDGRLITPLFAVALIAISTMFSNPAKLYHRFLKK